MLLGTEPPDILSYGKGHDLFPHESTADQWFSESQTESYRMLGQLTVESLCQQEWIRIGKIRGVEDLVEYHFDELTDRSDKSTARPAIVWKPDGEALSSSEL